MKRNMRVGSILVLVVGLILAGRALANPAAPTAVEQDQAVGMTVDTTFSYQGRIEKGVDTFSGVCAMRFTLWDQATAGDPVGTTLLFNSVTVNQGLFTVMLNFGDQFTGEKRWLETAVQCPGDAGYTTLEPRQALAAVPYAMSLRPGGSVESQDDNGFMGIANSEGRGGLVGLHYGQSGYGVYGAAVNGGGVVGISDNWIGVYGETEAPAATGAAGIYGRSRGNAGMGVAGKADQAGSIGVKGVANEDDSYGVWGESQKYTGVYGTSTDWVGVWGRSANASGVWGQSSSEFSAGVYGENLDGGKGVIGISGKGIGVHGTSEDWVGVFGETSTAGVAAVWGRNNSPGGIAGRFDGTVQITGGADLAERFKITGGDDVQPGTLLIIDLQNPGQLMASSTPYDVRVAGIVSGAGGVQPGLTLHQEGLLEGDAQVAIAGRVYVRAEADSAPIQPGDLLTTSAQPGLAMKAADRDRAYGAVIGKALSGLDKGTGLVLVLVNLQ